MGLLWKKMGNLVTWDIEKAERFNYFCALVFTSKCFSHTDNVTGCKSRDSHYCRRKPGVRLSKDPEGVQVHGTDEMNLWVMREPVEEVVKPLSIVFEKSWQSSEVPTDLEKGNITSFLKKENQKDLGKYRPISLTLCLARSWRRFSWKLC